MQSMQSYDGLCSAPAVPTNEAERQQSQQANTLRINCSRERDTQVMSAELRRLATC